VGAELVDIVVPVYSGAAETTACLESVLSSELPAATQIIVINDSSPESALVAYLQRLAERSPRVRLLHNQTNQGFVKTANRGMREAAGRDVVLLNSDTLVANDWIGRLQAIAYGHTDIGTVTPFSNNATICSYPRFCEDNRLPGDTDLGALDRLFGQCNKGSSVEIPTAVGFCMYIRRDCLEQIGLFDEARFGKGYGEENDFCMRAYRQGWRHLLAADTFVFHQGSVSFQAERNEFLQRGLDVVRDLHPDYEALVQRHILDDPARQYRTAVDLARLRRSPLPRILLVGHNRGGGTEKHMWELSEYLEGRCHFLAIKPHEGEQTLLYWMSRGESLKLYFHLPQDFGRLVKLLKSLGIGRVHYHHTLGVHPAVRDIWRDLGMPYELTVHDYYLACPQITLTGAENRYCEEQSKAQCDACLSKVPGVPAIDQWRSESSRLVEGAFRVTAPSEDAASRFRRYFPRGRIAAAPHPDAERLSLREPVRAAKLAPGEPLRIVVIGAISAIKGADILEGAALDAASRKLAVDFHLLGYAYRSLVRRKSVPLTVHGPYDDDDLPGLLAGLHPHIVWFPALWPETYSYTLSACLALGLCVATTDLGAFPERLAGRPMSWIGDWRWSPARWNDFFLEVRKQLEVAAPEIVWDTGPDPQGREFYRDSYLDGLTAPAGDTVVPSWFAEHLHPRVDRWQQTRRALHRSALRALLWLRAAPGLRSVAKRVPMSWQRQIKSWLIK